MSEDDHTESDPTTQPTALPHSPTNETTALPRVDLMLVLVASAALVLNCLLTSPPAFSDAHKNDNSLLKTVVAALALTTPSAEQGAFPTIRGVEIRNLFFYSGAALLMLLAGLHFALSHRRPRLTADDLFDLRARAAGPFFWWGLLILISAVTSLFSDRSEICRGQMIVRFMHIAWWLPLATLLSRKHVRTLIAVLVATLVVTAMIGLWYHAVRGLPGQPLAYPIGNALWFGACLLPGIFLAAGLAARAWGRRSPDASGSTSWKRPMIVAVCGVAMILIAFALYMTRSRSAQVGLVAGLFTIIFFLVGRKIRPVVALVAIALAIVGVQQVYHLAETGEMGRRAHSVRSRLNHEWPYAINLFLKKPVGGHGEGGYALLAGQYARNDQLGDPSVMASDDLHWTAHAHNEFLELLADIGLAGVAAFVMAILVTLHWAAKHFDRLRREGRSFSRCGLIIGLAAAFVAMIVEECSSVALRHPGFTPIFLTIWALLWVLVRRERPAAVVTGGAPRLDAWTLRWAGIGAVLTGVMLGYFGIQNWRAERSHFEAALAFDSGEFSAATRGADFAGEALLDPMRKMVARMLAVRSRASAFERTLMDSEQPPGDSGFALSREAWVKLARINMAAPHFLGVSRLASELARARVEAYRRQGDLQSARDCSIQYLLALDESRRDEPFQIDLVERLWRDKGNATLAERLVWMRELLRRQLVNERFGALLRDYGSRPDSGSVMEDMHTLAMQDAQRAVADWQDPMSPETLRIVAVAKDWSGEHAEAAELAGLAAEMYGKAGPRLFVAHAAALLENVRYQLHADPKNKTDEKLRRLVEASEIMNGPMAEQGDAALRVPLPAEAGHMRLLVLLAAGREGEAEEQMRRLRPVDATPVARQMAILYAGLAEQFSFMPEHAELALRWARRATELGGHVPEAWYVMTILQLQSHDDAAALAAARQFIACAPQRETAFAYLGQLEARWSDSGVWAELRRTVEDYPPPTTQPTSRPVRESTRETTTQPVNHAPDA